MSIIDIYIYKLMVTTHKKSIIDTHKKCVRNPKIALK